MYKFLSDHQEKYVYLDITYQEDMLRYRDTDKEIIQAVPEGANGISYTRFGDSKLFCASSNFDLGPYGQSLKREKGGLGFWIKNKKTTVENDLDFAYQIAIHTPSNGNQTYYWGFSETKNDPASDIKYEEIKGYFFVNKKAAWDKYEAAYMVPKYYDEKCWSIGADICYSPDVFMLEPISKREILQVR